MTNGHDALRAIKPKRSKFLDPKEFQRAIHDALEESGETALKEFESTVTTWSDETKPTFTLKVTKDTASVSTDSEIYKFVDKGTKPHDIAPTKRSRLRFQQAYVPKTTPRVVGSQSGGGVGDFVFTRKVVHHPGTEARGFTEEIRRRASKTMPKLVQDKLKKAAR